MIGSISLLGDVINEQSYKSTGLKVKSVQLDLANPPMKYVMIIWMQDIGSTY